MMVVCGGGPRQVPCDACCSPFGGDWWCFARFVNGRPWWGTFGDVMTVGPPTGFGVGEPVLLLAEHDGFLRTGA